MKFAKFSIAALSLSAILLAGCAAPPSTTLHFSPISPRTQMSAQANSKAQVNLVTKDERAQPEISAYTKSGELIKLNASPTVAQLFQNIVQKDLTSKGFKLVNNGGNASVLVRVKEFYAQVGEGNFLHKITSRVQLEIHVQGATGNFTKNLGATRTDEGALGASHNDIQKSLTAVLKDVVDALYKDKEVADAINRY